MGWSSDGDPRLLSAMCHQVAKDNDDVTNYTQDMTHVATKLRNRLLRSKEMVMGRKNVSIKPLMSLLEHVQKSVHGITKSDICPQDRQNFGAYMKITNNRVIDALKKSIPDSDAIVHFLTMCHNITSSYLDHEIAPLERVFRIFRSIYFLRMWRNDLIQSSRYNLQDNFITNNAYNCIELNGRCMLNLINQLRNQGSEHFFLLPLFDSQTCENMFRLLRSMGTVKFTKINFSLYDVFHMTNRLEIQNDIAYNKLNDNVTFPVNHKRQKKTKLFDLPTESEIENTLAKAKEAAVVDAVSMGICPEIVDYFDFHTRINVNDIEDDLDIDEENHDEILDEDNLIEEAAYTEETAYTTIVDENDKEVLVRKSTLVWMLTEPSVSLSKDRLRRVRVTNTQR